MLSFKNAVEALVAKEAKLQLEELHPEIKQRINLSEVVAFALNRLPAMYATTQYGWIQQRGRAMKELGIQIGDAVRRGIQTVQLGDPLHDPAPVPEAELSCEARSLIRLRKILGRSGMRWRDLPAIIQIAIDEKWQGGTFIQERHGHLSLTERSAVMDVKAYLQKVKRRNITSALGKQAEERWATDMKILDRLTVEQKELEDFLLQAQLGYSNVLEKFVTSVTQHLLRHLLPEARSRVKVAEVVACALNHLPAMYATSCRGYKVLRQQAQSELLREVVAAVRAAILIVGKHPRPFAPPLPFNKFGKETDAAIAEIRQLLKRQDLTWNNVVEAVAHEISSKTAIGSPHHCLNAG